MSQPEVLAAARSAEGLPAGAEMPRPALDPSAEARLGALGGGEWVQHTTMAAPILPPGEGTGPAPGVEQTPGLVVPIITPAVERVPGRTYDLVVVHGTNERDLRASVVRSFLDENGVARYEAMGTQTVGFLAENLVRFTPTSERRISIPSFTLI